MSSDPPASEAYEQHRATPPVRTQRELLPSPSATLEPHNHYSLHGTETQEDITVGHIDRTHDHAKIKSLDPLFGESFF